MDPQIPVTPPGLSEREGIVKVEGGVRVNGNDRMGAAVRAVSEVAL